MLRRSFFKLAGACMILPALRWVPLPETEHERYMRLVNTIRERMVMYFHGAPVKFVSSLSSYDDPTEWDSIVLFGPDGT